ncbi:PIN domain-like protein [Stereum hirsutum FP-91666 SS1]|uniref:PIN domain-like protein n=1 Tax=Stereum hirsutum (strain FP-91666) TaxID=721885 RepID=UPI000440CC86|nr:PIN domain-like protein [Stereum hirsutum FP-91666 SS1]EIM91541.1 PIN domain-like protein [Stereum hirsutum FP-91666 SS1]
MGIPGLWKELEPVARNLSLVEFGIVHGLAAEGGPKQARIGIDAAVFVYKALGKFKRRYSGSPPMPELQDIVSKLLRLAQTPLTPIFVFDGPKRPKVKRERQTVFRVHWLAQVFRKFIEVMGFLCLDAPGEAEAELARLSEEGFIDAVMSEDIDALAFGARAVIRIVNFSEDVFKIYHAADCENNPDLRLTRAGIVLVALLSGGDYDKGLTGFGATTAIRVARYGLGDVLLQIADMPPAMQALELPLWRARLVDILANDPQGFLRQREVQLSTSIPSTFPNMDTAKLYYHPVIRPSPRSSPFPSDSNIIPRPINLCRFLELASGHLWWNTYELLARRGFNTIFPSLLTRETLAIIDNPKLKITSPIKKICQLRKRSPTTTGVASFRIEYDAAAYLATIRQSLDDSSAPVPSHEPSLQRMWIPTVVLERTLPELVAEYRQRHSIKTSAQDKHTIPQVSSGYGGRVAQPPLLLGAPVAGPSSDAMPIIGRGLASSQLSLDPFESSDEEEHLSDQRLSENYWRLLRSSTTGIATRLNGDCDDGADDALELSSKGSQAGRKGSRCCQYQRGRASEGTLQAVNED